MIVAVEMRTTCDCINDQLHGLLMNKLALKRLNGVTNKHSFAFDRLID